MEIRTIQEEDGTRTEGISKIWIDFEDEKYCVETEMQGRDGMAMQYVTIQNQGHVFVLNVQAKTAQEIPPDVGAGQMYGWKESPDFIRFGGVNVGLDTVAGHETEIYEYVKLEDRGSVQTEEENQAGDEKEREDGLAEIMAASGRQTRVRQWIWKGTQFPLKTIVDEGARQTTTETMHIVVDADIPERVFVVPKDYAIKKMQP
jgi:hypothetical protein